MSATHAPPSLRLELRIAAQGEPRCIVVLARGEAPREVPPGAALVRIEGGVARVETTRGGAARELPPGGALELDGCTLALADEADQLTVDERTSWGSVELRIRTGAAGAQAFAHRLPSAPGAELVAGSAADACELVLADPHVSKRHARFFARDGVWHVEDLGSKNGTRVNDVRIESATPLAHRDVVRIGASALELHSFAAEVRARLEPAPPAPIAAPRAEKSWIACALLASGLLAAFWTWRWIGDPA